ncbi:hypothetical protein [Prevotella pallens]|uniref:hypothetical protein n=1 Tax=Prevotella pallens TaxID=60133 RepID=UPI0023F20CCA|nr:hypothetical protein [Prevotella pallens]
MVYNITSPANTEYLVAKNDGANTLLQGNVTCDNGDEIAVFFPYQNSGGVGNQHKVDISLNMSNLTDNGEVVNRAQDGKLENLKYFDFSYGKTHVTTTSGSNNVTGNVQMRKQYAVLRLKFKTDGQELKNLKKLTVSNVITGGKFDMSTGQLTETQKGDITITPAAPLDSFVVAVFPEDHFRPTFTVVGSDNKTYRFSVGVDLPIANADYAPYVVAVKEFTPYIDINGTKWGKYNLQYSTGTKVDGWVDGYHLAENPWDYYTTDDVETPLVGDRAPMTPNPFDPNNVQFDHFRWGDIEKAYDYRNAAKTHYWDTTSDISRVVKSDKEYGDLATYASNDKWRLPKAQEFDNLMLNTAEYIGYYVNDKGNTIYGVLFDPNVPQNLKNKVVDKNNVVIGPSNQAAPKTIDKNRLRKFEKSDFERALFFPMAGVYDDYNNLMKVGTQAGYWTSTSSSSTQAKAFMPQVFNNGSITKVFGGLTNTRLIKSNMYSIRPIYIGQ